MLVFNDRLRIVRGEDKPVIFKLRDKATGDPVNLESITNITIKLTKSNRSELVLDSNLKPAKKAFIDIGLVRIMAENAGGIGNSITLHFDGFETLDQVVSRWNNDNPENSVIHNGTGLEIYQGDYQLEGGFEAYRPVTAIGEPLLGKIRLNLTEYDTASLRKGSNQTIAITLDWGHPPSGTRKIARLNNRLDVLDSLD